MQPAVSIIMNCLNCAEDLPSALDSVKKQTFKNWEIIFWDNGSTDKSAEIANAFGNGLRYFKSDKTVSLGEARNLAITQAKGEFIAFLDCDDLWKPEKLEKQLELFNKNPKTGLVCTDTEIFDGKRILGKMFDAGAPGRGMVFDALMQRQWISMSSAIIRKKALDSLMPDSVQSIPQWFDQRFNLCEEADVFYRIAHDWELDYVPEALTIWRVHGKNTTFRKFSQFADETLLILEKHRKIYPDYDIKHKQTAELLKKRAAFQKAIALWRNGNNANARLCIKPWLNNSLRFRLFWCLSFLPGSFFDIAAKLYFALPPFLRK